MKQMKKKNRQVDRHMRQVPKKNKKVDYRARQAAKKNRQENERNKSIQQAVDLYRGVEYCELFSQMESEESQQMVNFMEDIMQTQRGITDPQERAKDRTLRMRAFRKQQLLSAGFTGGMFVFTQDERLVGIDSMEF